MAKPVSQAPQSPAPTHTHPAFGIRMGDCPDCRARMNLVADASGDGMKVQYRIPNHNVMNSHKLCPGAGKLPLSK